MQQNYLRWHESGSPVVKKPNLSKYCESKTSKLAQQKQLDLISIEILSRRSERKWRDICVVVVVYLSRHLGTNFSALNPCRLYLVVRRNEPSSIASVCYINYKSCFFLPKASCESVITTFRNWFQNNWIIVKLFSPFSLSLSIPLLTPSSKQNCNLNFKSNFNSKQSIIKF